MPQFCHIPKFGEQIKICQNWPQDYDAVILVLQTAMTLLAIFHDRIRDAHYGRNMTAESLHVHVYYYAIRSIIIKKQICFHLICLC